jgi:hypothetical protein
MLVEVGLHVFYNALWGLKCLQGPNGLHVVVNDTWCKTEICKQVYTKEKIPASCINGVCQFNAPYGKNESLEALLTFANVSLSNNSVPIDEKYKLLPMIFGYHTIPSQPHLVYMFNFLKVVLCNFLISFSIQH